MTEQATRLRERTGDEPMLLDVRTPGEFETAHIEGAVNVPLDELGGWLERADRPRRPVVLVCQSGSRAERARQQLVAAGWDGLNLLEGGMNAYLARGGAVVRGRARVSLERQVRMVAGGLVAAGSLAALLLDPLFALLPAFVGSGLVFAGVTDTCGMGMLLARLPYNRPDRAAALDCAV